MIRLIGFFIVRGSRVPDRRSDVARDRRQGRVGRQFSLVSCESLPMLAYLMSFIVGLSVALGARAQVWRLVL
jgi:hypothetical protein